MEIKQIITGQKVNFKFNGVHNGSGIVVKNIDGRHYMVQLTADLIVPNGEDFYKGDQIVVIANEFY